MYLSKRFKKFICNSPWSYGATARELAESSPDWAGKAGYHSNQMWMACRVAQVAAKSRVAKAKLDSPTAPRLTRPVPKATGHYALNGWAVDKDFMRLLQQEIGVKCGDKPNLPVLDSLLGTLRQMGYVTIA